MSNIDTDGALKSSKSETFETVISNIVRTSFFFLLEMWRKERGKKKKMKEEEEEVKKKMDGNSGPVPILFGEKSEINECVTCYPQPRHLCKHKVAVIAHLKKKKKKKNLWKFKANFAATSPPLSLSLSSADVIVVVAIVAQPEMTNGRHLVATIDYYYQQQQQHQQQQQQQCEQRWNENTGRSDTPWPRFSNQISRPDSLTTDYWPINSSCW